MEEKGNSQASGIESSSETACFRRLILLVPTIIGTVLLHSVVGTTNSRVETAASKKGSLMIVSIYPEYGRVGPSTTLTCKSSPPSHVLLAFGTYAL